MKDFIVLIATVVLGAVLAGLILGMQNSAKDLSDKANNMIKSIFPDSSVVLYVGEDRA